MSSFSVSITPTVGTAAYIAGDAVGGNPASGTSAIYQIPFGLPSGGGTVYIDSIHITDKSKTHPALFIEFFKATPSGGTYTDGSPIVYGSGDHANKLPIISILATDWVDLPRTGSATSSTVSINDISMAIAPTTQYIYALIHADSAFSLTAGDWGITFSGRQI